MYGKPKPSPLPIWQKAGDATRYFTNFDPADPGARCIVILTPAELMSEYPLKHGTPPVCRDQFGRPVFSTGKLECAAGTGDNVETWIVCTRSSLSESDEWWLTIHGNLDRVFLAAPAGDPVYSRLTGSQHLTEPWYRLVIAIGAAQILMKRGEHRLLTAYNRALYDHLVRTFETPNDMRKWLDRNFYVYFADEIEPSPKTQRSA